MNVLRAPLPLRLDCDGDCAHCGSDLLAVQLLSSACPRATRLRLPWAVRLSFWPCTPIYPPPPTPTALLLRGTHRIPAVAACRHSNPQATSSSACAQPRCIPKALCRQDSHPVPCLWSMSGYYSRIESVNPLAESSHPTAAEASVGRFSAAQRNEPTAWPALHLQLESLIPST
jgi:hypothetical protein